jgi:hypothetical protein
VLPHEVSAPLAEVPGHVDGALPLDVPNHLCNRILGRRRLSKPESSQVR